MKPLAPLAIRCTLVRPARVALAVLVTLLAQPVIAQAPPRPAVRAPAPAAAPEWTVQRSRSAIELLPELRVPAPQAGTPERRRTLRVERHGAQEASIGEGLQGVVFDHGLQAYGALTGEISLRLAPDALHRAEAVAAAAGLAGARRLARSDYFVLRAASPQQLRDALLRLRAQPGVLEADWVVSYDLPRQPLDAARAAAR